MLPSYHPKLPKQLLHLISESTNNIRVLLVYNISFISLFFAISRMIKNEKLIPQFFKKIISQHYKFTTQNRIYVTPENGQKFYQQLKHYIRFSLISTMEDKQPNRPHQPYTVHEVNLKPQENEDRGFLTYYFNCLSSQLLHLSNYLNIELIKNQSLIDAATSQSYQPSNPSQKGSKSENNSTSSNLDLKQMVKVSPDQHKKRSSRKRKPKDSSQSQQYQPQSDVQEKWSYYNTNFSKQIATEYFKAIFDFIQKETKYISRLLNSLDIEQKQFKESLQKYRGKVNSFVQFHSLWHGPQKNISKAFRIISMHYCRKYRLSDIFTSKGNNYFKHIKYRSKILETIKKPCLQDYQTNIMISVQNR